ncbi:MAG: ABC transporter ATP-binding protein/permease [Pisciglobus halotolerans]|nr:ABC transporter ATP-binding protein/permease [Pisciglobus halotolerans]
MNTVKTLFRYSLQKKRQFSIGFVLLAAAVAADLMGPLVIQRIIDFVILPATSSVLKVDLLFQNLAIFFGLTLFTAAARYVSYLALTAGANTVVRNMRDDLFEHIQKLPIRFFDHSPAGKIVSRITNDTEQLRILYVVVLGQIVTNVLYLLGIYVALFRIHPTYGWVTSLLIPLFIGWAFFYQRFSRPYTTNIRSLISDINGTLNESITGMPIIQSFQQEKKMEEEFKDTNKEWFDYSQKFTLLDSIGSFSFVSLIRNSALLFLLLYFSNRFLNGQLTLSIGFLYVFVDYTTRLFNPIQGIVTQFSYLQTALASARRVVELQAVPADEEVPNELEFQKGIIEFNHVSFAYVDEHYVLKDITFTAAPGETIALVGRTGSGKSTIMNLLFRFYDPISGEIKIDGVPTTTVSRKSLRKYMGIVLQDPYLFKGTIASNVAFGNKDISREMIEKAVQAVGGDVLLQNMAAGIDEPVADKGATLSAGQRQLISFARALAFDPKVLVLDEATSSIDTETEEIIQHAMKVVKKGRTTFIVAHRLSTIQHADQILVLDKGRIVEKGTHESLLKEAGLYADMYQTQVD